MQNILGVY